MVYPWLYNKNGDLGMVYHGFIIGFSTLSNIIQYYPILSDISWKTPLMDKNIQCNLKNITSHGSIPRFRFRDLQG